MKKAARSGLEIGAGRVIQAVVSEDDKGFWIGLTMVGLLVFAAVVIAIGALLRVGWGLF